MRRFAGMHRLSRALPITIAALAALLLPAALAGPAMASDDDDARTWTVQVGSETPNKAIQGMSFLPKNIYVNAGDTVKWVANSAEIHTVTFLAKGKKLKEFDPFNPAELLQRGRHSYDGKSYYNSGVMSNVRDSGFPAVKRYSLVFPHTGNFTYYCLVHGKAMKGTVHVRRDDTSYPFTQKQYDRHSRAVERAIVRDGHALERIAEHQAGKHKVIEGADDGVAMVMRFFKPTIVIHVGEKVTFVNNGMGAPHTVTFGKEPANPFAKTGNPAHFTGGNLSSGVQGPDTKFTVTFKKAGTFKYICALHDFMGMVGKVIVQK